MGSSGAPNCGEDAGGVVAALVMPSVGYVTLSALESDNQPLAEEYVAPGTVTATATIAEVLRLPQPSAIGDAPSIAPMAAGAELRVSMRQEQVLIDQREMEAGSTLLAGVWPAPTAGGTVAPLPPWLTGEIALKPSGDISVVSACSAGVEETLKSEAGRRNVTSAPGSVPFTSGEQALAIQVASDPHVATAVFTTPVSITAPSIVVGDVPNPGPVSSQSPTLLQQGPPATGGQ